MTEGELLTTIGASRRVLGNCRLFLKLRLEECDPEETKFEWTPTGGFRDFQRQNFTSVNDLPFIRGAHLVGQKSTGFFEGLFGGKKVKKSRSYDEEDKTIHAVILGTSNDILKTSLGGGYGLSFTHLFSEKIRLVPSRVDNGAIDELQGENEKKILNTQQQVFLSVANNTPPKVIIPRTDDEDDGEEEEEEEEDEIEPTENNLIVVTYDTPHFDKGSKMMYFTTLSDFLKKTTNVKMIIRKKVLKYDCLLRKLYVAYFIKNFNLSLSFDQLETLGEEEQDEKKKEKRITTFKDFVHYVLEKGGSDPFKEEEEQKLANSNDWSLTTKISVAVGLAVAGGIIYKRFMARKNKK